MTSTKKKEGGSESAFDLEQHFILRLPTGPAIALRHDIQMGSLTLKDKLSIELMPDHRHGNVRYGGEIFSAKLMDIPCVCESLKTVDGKTFNKTADISQVLVCTTEDEISQEESDSPKKKDKDKRYQMMHGITPPLKNVRKRRFRKTLKKKYMEQPDIEKEVKRLFRTDAEAIDVKWEVVTEDEKPLDGSVQIPDNIQISGTVSASQLLLDDPRLQLGEHDIFGDLSSSEEEDKDINIMDSGEDETSRDAPTPREDDASRDTPTSQTEGSMKMENQDLDIL